MAATLTCTTASSTSIKASITGMGSGHDRTRYFYWYVDGDYVKTTTAEPYATSHSTTITGLSPATEYTILVEIRDTPAFDYEIMAELDDTAWTETPYYFEVGLPTDTTVGVVVYELSKGDKVRVYIRTGKASGTGTGVYDKSHTASGSTLLVDGIGGLTPDTWYTMNVSVNSGDWLGGQEFETGQAAAKRPDDWGWWSAIETGAEIQLSADEWNAFTECIDAFRVYAGLHEYDDFTTVYSGRTAISASIVNEARKAISEIPGHGTLPSAAVAGEPIRAAFFNGLESALNYVE